MEDVAGDDSDSDAGEYTGSGDSMGSGADDALHDEDFADDVESINATNNLDVLTFGACIWTARFYPSGMPGRSDGLFVVAAWELPSVTHCAAVTAAAAGQEGGGAIAANSAPVRVAARLRHVIAAYPHARGPESRKVNLRLNRTDHRIAGWPDVVAWDDGTHVHVAAQLKLAADCPDGQPAYKHFERFVDSPEVCRSLTVNLDHIVICGVWPGFTGARVYNAGLDWSHFEVAGEFVGCILLADRGDSAWLVDGSSRLITLAHAAAVAAHAADADACAVMHGIRSGATDRRETYASDNNGIHRWMPATQTWECLFRCSGGTIAATSKCDINVVVRLWDETSMVTMIFFETGGPVAQPVVPDVCDGFCIPSTWSVSDMFAMFDDDANLRMVFVRPNAMVMAYDGYGTVVVTLEFPYSIPADEPVVPPEMDLGAETVAGGTVADGTVAADPVVPPEMDLGAGTVADGTESSETLDTRVELVVMLGADRVAVGSAGGRVQVFNMHTGVQLANLNFATVVAAGAASADGTMVVFATDEELRLYDCTVQTVAAADVQSTISRADPDAHFDTPQDDGIATLEMRERVVFLRAAAVDVSNCITLDLSPCGRFVFAASDDRVMLLAHTPPSRELHMVWQMADVSADGVFVGLRHLVVKLEPDFEVDNILQFVRYGLDDDAGADAGGMATVSVAFRRSAIPCLEPLQRPGDYVEMLLTGGAQCNVVGVVGDTCACRVFVVDDSVDGRTPGRCILVAHVPVSINDGIISPDGTVMVLRLASQMVSVWHIPTGTCMREEPKSPLFSCVPYGISADNRVLVSLSGFHGRVRTHLLPTESGTGPDRERDLSVATCVAIHDAVHVWDGRECVGARSTDAADL
jgi:hypothetical protein